MIKHFDNFRESWYNVSMILLQMPTTYPEDRFLVPSFYIGLTVYGFCLIFALVLGIIMYKRKAEIKKSNTVEVSETKVETNVEVNKVEPEEKPELKYYAVIGNHEEEITEDEIKSVKRQGLKVIQR